MEWLEESGQQAADEGWNGGFGSHEMNAFSRRQYIYIYTDNASSMLWSCMSLLV